MEKHHQTSQETIAHNESNILVQSMSVRTKRVAYLLDPQVTQKKRFTEKQRWEIMQFLSSLQKIQMLPKEAWLKHKMVKQIFLEIAEWIYIEYGQIDMRFWLRRDGSTHWSHAWETLNIQSNTIGYITLVSLFGLLLHDFFEDMKPIQWQEFPSYTNYLITLLEQKLLILNMPDFSQAILTYIRNLTKPHLVLRQWKNESYEDFIQRKRWKKARIDYRYNIRISKYSDEEFIGKCSDRFHALTHFDKNPLPKVLAKVQETEVYFLREIEHRIELNQSVGDGFLHTLYSRILKLFTTQIALCRKTISYSEARKTRLYCIDHENIVRQKSNTYAEYFNQYYI